jgi:hypothetical protein
MTLDEFAAVTQRVIARDGFDDFQPAAIYPERNHIRGGANFPSTVPEAHVLLWAAEDTRDGEEILVAFKVDDSHFKVVRRIGLYSEDQTYAVTTPYAWPNDAADGWTAYCLKLLYENVHRVFYSRSRQPRLILFSLDEKALGCWDSNGGAASTSSAQIFAGSLRFPRHRLVDYFHRLCRERSIEIRRQWALGWRLHGEHSSGRLDPGYHDENSGGLNSTVASILNGLLRRWIYNRRTGAAFSYTVATSEKWTYI